MDCLPLLTFNKSGRGDVQIKGSGFLIFKILISLHHIIFVREKSKLLIQREFQYYTTFSTIWNGRNIGKEDCLAPEKESDNIPALKNAIWSTEFESHSYVPHITYTNLSLYKGTFET